MKHAVLLAVGLLGATVLGGCIQDSFDAPPVLTLAGAIQYAQAQATNVSGQPLMYVSGYQAGNSSSTAPGSTSAWALGYANLTSLTLTTVVVQTPGWNGSSATSYSYSNPLTPGLMAVFSPMPSNLTGAGAALAVAQALVPGGIKTGMSTNYFAVSPNGVLTWAIQIFNSTWSSTVYVGPNGPTVSPWPAQSFLTATNTLRSGLQAMGITSPIEIIGVTGKEWTYGGTERMPTPFGFQHGATAMIPPDDEFGDGLAPVWAFVVYLPDLAEHMHVAVYSGLPLAVSGPYPIGALAGRANDYAIPSSLIDTTQIAYPQQSPMTMHIVPGTAAYPWLWAWGYKDSPFVSNGMPGDRPYYDYFDAQTGAFVS